MESCKFQTAQRRQGIYFYYCYVAQTREHWVIPPASSSWSSHCVLALLLVNKPKCPIERYPSRDCIKSEGKWSRHSTAPSLLYGWRRGSKWDQQDLMDMCLSSQGLYLFLFKARLLSFISWDPLSTLSQKHSDSLFFCVPLLGPPFSVLCWERALSSHLGRRDVWSWERLGRVPRQPRQTSEYTVSHRW